MRKDNSNPGRFNEEPRDLQRTIFRAGPCAPCSSAKRVPPDPREAAAIRGGTGGGGGGGRLAMDEVVWDGDGWKSWQAVLGELGEDAQG